MAKQKKQSRLHGMKSTSGGFIFTLVFTGAVVILGPALNVLNRDGLTLDELAYVDKVLEPLLPQYVGDDVEFIEYSEEVFDTESELEVAMWS